jgi:outer membrane biosynthesis protein TonB
MKIVITLLVFACLFISACESTQPANEQNIIRSQPVEKAPAVDNVDKIVVQTSDESQEEKESELVAEPEVDVETAEPPVEEDKETAEEAVEEAEETVENNKVKVDLSQEELDKLRKDIEGIETEDLGGVSSD